MAHRLLLFEGLPGSGKTTLSRAVADELNGRGRPCEWHLEEAHDHPWFGRAFRRAHREPGFAARCLEAWGGVIRDLERTSWSLDGAAWQSTVRFMFEQCWADADVDDYWRACNDLLAPHGPVLVHLRHPDAARFVRDHTRTVRADVWAKMTRHVESTPRGRSIAAAGRDPEIAFWVGYRELCDRLAAAASIPVLEVDLAAGWTEPNAVLASIDDL